MGRGILPVDRNSRKLSVQRAFDFSDRTGAIYAAMELGGVSKLWSFLFMAVAMLLFVTWVLRRGGATFHAHGFRSDNLRVSAYAVAPCTLLGIAALLLWAWITGRPLWQPSMMLLMPLYLPFGVFQQWVFQGVLNQRLQLLLGGRLPAVALTTAAFTLVHVGYGKLMVLTAIAGLGWSAAFARWPNVWTVGVSHGMLAAVAYPVVLGDDPLARLWR